MCYCGDQECATEDDFIKIIRLDSNPFAKIRGMIAILEDSDIGNPRGNKLLAKLEKFQTKEEW